VWSLRPDVIERETKKATSAREYPKLLLLLPLEPSLYHETGRRRLSSQ
jgi:hypothetical protein